MLISHCLFANLQVVEEMLRNVQCLLCVCVCVFLFFFFFAKWLGRLKTKVFVPLKTICEKYHSPAAHLQ